MNFANGHILWLWLVFLPLLAVFFWWSWRKRQALMTLFIQARLLPALTVGISPARQKIRFACIIVAVALLIVTLARPQWGFSWEETKQKGLDIVVAIDTSKSMLAEDITPNRLARAKLAAMDLMQQAKSDRLGLVAFAGSAFLQCPLTIDDTAFRQSVESLDVNIIPQGGTAIAEAINTALNAFKEGDNYKVLVLFTDGEDNDEGALAAAQDVAKEGMKIFTVGIGTAEGELLRVTDAKGRTDYIRDEQGNVVKSHLNEALLQQIAGATEGGFYLPLRGAKTIDTLYERGLAPLPKSEQSTRLVKRYHEQYHWPLAAAILLLLIEMLLPERRPLARREHTNSLKLAVPEAGAPNLRATAMIALIILPGVAFSSPSSALREYNSGNYDESLKEYKRVLQRKTNDVRLHFNAGAAAYRNQKLEEAAKQFGQATAAQDLKLQQQAYYNLGNTLYWLGDSNPDMNKKMETWQSALKQYDGAIKLNTNDADAKFNYAFVKKKLEELKQQQQQQDQKQDQQQNQQQQNQQNQQQQQQSQNDQQSQQKQDSGQQDKQQQQQSQQKQEQEKQQAENQSSQQKDQQKKDEQQAKSSAGEKKDKPDEQQGEQQTAEARGVQPMTPQEARQLLDAQKGEEQFLQFKPGEKRNREDKPVKDW